MRIPHFLVLAVALSALLFVSCPPSAAQTTSNGSIEFAAYVRPEGGQSEPVREMTFYLLSKSLADIRKEAEAAEPFTDLDHFIIQLGVSPELKVWMTKHHQVNLAGNDFVKELTPDDVINVPEFLSAYNDQNGAAVHAGVPEPKYKKDEQQKDPEKYKRQREQYQQALRHYIEAHPDLMQGLDAEFSELNPYPRWMKVQAQQQHHLEQRVMQLAQTRYLVDTAVTSLNGKGAFQSLNAGQYWISNLDTPALSGDFHLLWDVPVNVSPARTARIELSNLNTVETAELAH